MCCSTEQCERGVQDAANVVDGRPLGQEEGFGVWLGVFGVRRGACGGMLQGGKDAGDIDEGQGCYAAWRVEIWSILRCETEEAWGVAAHRLRSLTV